MRSACVAYISNISRSNGTMYDFRSQLDIVECITNWSEDDFHILISRLNGLRSAYEQYVDSTYVRYRSLMFTSSITRYLLRSAFGDNNGCNGFSCHTRERWKGHYIRIRVSTIQTIQAGYLLLRKNWRERDTMWRGVIILNIAGGWLWNFWRRSKRRCASLREEPVGEQQRKELTRKISR